MKNRQDIITRIFLALGFLGLGPMVQAVSPSPDGGYPGFITAEGTSALFSLTTGFYNTALGGQALFHDTSGYNNTAVGLNALFFNVSGIDNTATGAQALQSNTGSSNTANGDHALFSNTIGSDNTAIGEVALFRNTTGGQNTAVGAGALSYNTSGNNNIVLGINAGNGVTTAHNVICIGANGLNVSNSCYIGKIFGSTSANGVTVRVDSNGRLGTMTSAARFKDEIKPIGKASQALLALKPVTFRYKKEIDPQGIAQFGLVAEDVDKVNPDLVVRDKEGEPYSVRYDQVNAMLLNEFLKEHKAFVEAQHKVEKLEAIVATLVATVKEQAAQIQKVSAQLQLNKPTPRTVRNNQ
jgi:hypothetical protein